VLVSAGDDLGVGADRTQDEACGDDEDQHRGETPGRLHTYSVLGFVVHQGLLLLPVSNAVDGKDATRTAHI